MLSKLFYFDLSNNELTTLPYLKLLTDISLEYTWFFHNKIGEAEFKKNLPDYALDEKS